MGDNMAFLGQVLASILGWVASTAFPTGRKGSIAAAGAILAMAGGLGLSAPAQASGGTINGAASLQTDGQCTAAIPSTFGVSFTATYQSADTGSLDTYSLFLLDGNGTIIGSSSQSISAATFSATSTLSVSTSQTPTDGSRRVRRTSSPNCGHGLRPLRLRSRATDPE
jgi:hypothetical protein